VSRGKSARHIDLKKDRPADDELVKLVTGPTGTLRAPAILRGKTLFVGFNTDVYESNLK
jgi:arsenate reductase-like glutaredoxin family protein